MKRKVRGWLHNHRYARLLNCSSNNFNHFGTAYVETFGPRFVGEWLAVDTVRKSSLTRADWGTIKITKTEQISRWRHRWLFRYQRITN